MQWRRVSKQRFNPDGLFKRGQICHAAQVAVFLDEAAGCLHVNGGRLPQIRPASVKVAMRMTDAYKSRKLPAQIACDELAKRK